MSNYSSRRSTKSKIQRVLKRPIKRLLNRISAKSAKFKKFYSKFKVSNRERRYDRHAGLPTKDKMVVFESFMGRKYADSPKAIYEFMLDNHNFDDYEFIWCFKDRCIDEYSFIEKNSRTTVLLWGSPKYYKTYAQAKYWFTNSRLPGGIKPKGGQVYVQCWHGTPLKRLGFDIEINTTDAKNDAHTVQDVYESDAKRYTYIISPSKYCSEKFRSAFNLESIGKGDIIIEEGYPRNDAIVNASQDDIDRIKRELNIPSGKKVILYAPTWRENQHTTGVGYIYDAPIDFNQLRDRIGEEYVILFRAHYFIANKFDFDAYGGYVVDVCNYPEINDLYVISDILITDYSSVFFDYGILKRPIIFYMYDLEYYKEQLRGFYIDINELPGPIIENQEMLEDTIKRLGEWTNTEEYMMKYNAFTKRFTYLDDGHATERVVKKIFNMK